MGGAVDVDSSAGDVVGVDSPEEGVICVKPDTLVVELTKLVELTNGSVVICLLSENHKTIVHSMVFQIIDC